LDEIEGVKPIGVEIAAGIHQNGTLLFSSNKSAFKGSFESQGT
jgi:hypothetical protein